jgi:hypothetical protein
MHRSMSRGATATVLFGLVTVTSAVGRAAVQPDPCADDAVRGVLADARRDVDRADDGAAAQRLQRAAVEHGACHEVGLGALAVDGWVEARRLALIGGAPDALARMHDTLARIAAVRAVRPATTLLAQMAAYADAVLRAAVAAAQDERDEMQVYLAHARTLADSLALAGITRPWPLPVDAVAGELWLEVDRFADARDAFARVADAGLAARVALGAGRALEQLKDGTAACVAYRRAAAGPLAPDGIDRARQAVVRLRCSER